MVTWGGLVTITAQRVRRNGQMRRPRDQMRAARCPEVLTPAWPAAPHPPPGRARRVTRMLARVFTEPQQGASYDDILAMALVAEETGFDAFFRSDHYMAFNGDGLPGPTDAWITLAGLARDTTRIRLG